MVSFELFVWSSQIIWVILISNVPYNDLEVA
jgi:hypothetical protein